MTTPVTDDPGTTEVVTDPVVTEPVNDPPYKAQLDALPESVRVLVEPQFKEWDKQVQERFTAQSAKLDPWKDLIDNADPETVTQALQLAQFMDAEPQKLVDALIDNYGLTKTQAQQVVTDSQTVTPDPELEGIPQAVLDKLAKVDSMEQAMQVMANHLNSQQQSTQAASAQAQLDQELTRLKDAYGEFDMDYVLTKTVANGGDAEAAVKAYIALVPPVKTETTAPTVIGGGGGAPAGEEVDMSKLSAKERKALVIDILAKSKEA